MTRVVEKVKAVDGVSAVKQTQAGSNLLLEIGFDPQRAEPRRIVAVVKATLESDLWNRDPVMTEETDDLSKAFALRTP
ncbi:MAG TPA: hypothetical protein VFB38_08910 [Chthonomonadaceae bacterium]|nr:hypothetical protein [Chthonomonadaceae bacterium]